MAPVFRFLPLKGETWIEFQLISDSFRFTFLGICGITHRWELSACCYSLQPLQSINIKKKNRKLNSSQPDSNDLLALVVVTVSNRIFKFKVEWNRNTTEDKCQSLRLGMGREPSFFAVGGWETSPGFSGDCWGSSYFSEHLLPLR